MEFDPLNETNGINLDNYFPQRRAFNTVLYVHKKFLNKFQGEVKKDKPKKKQDVKKNIFKVDKSVNCNIKEHKIKNEGLHDDSVVNQTIKFAKNIAQRVLPPSESDDLVDYTVKTCNKFKKKDKCSQVSKPDKTEVIFARNGSKKLAETYRREKMDQSYSSRNSVSHSSFSNTLDEVNMNPSLSCTISNLSDNKDKNHKKGFNQKRKRRNSEKFAISESLEGFATEINDGETKIKIQLMNDKEKGYLTESIKIPVVKAVKDCLSQLKSFEMIDELKNVERTVKCHSQKLNAILDRLACIEKHLSNSDKVSNPRSKRGKSSRLEQLGENLNENKYSSEDDSSKLDKNSHRLDVSELGPCDDRVEILGCGEVTGIRQSTSVGVRTDKPGRLPARFCWTDTQK